jgi:hypothetical protein
VDSSPEAAPSGATRSTNRALGAVILAASGSGFPLTQLALARLGRPGALLVGAVTVGLLARDLAMIARGAPSRLEAGPAALLYAETAVAAVAAATCLALATDDGLEAARTRGWHVGRIELLRRVAMGTLFGIHTMRYRIYLAPGRGVREAAASPRP